MVQSNDKEIRRRIPPNNGHPPRTSNDRPKPKLRRAGLEFLKFYILTGFMGLFLAGFSYVNQLYDRFALALHEVGIGYLETFEYVAHLFGHDEMGFTSVAIATIVLTSVFVAGARILLDDVWFYPSVLLLLMCLAFLAIKGGTYYANSYVDGLIEGEIGRPAYCAVKEDAGIPARVKESLEEVSKEGRIRMLHQTEEMVYLFVRKELEPGDVYGEHLALRREDLSHCRVIAGEPDNS